MIIRNDASGLNFFGFQAGCEITGVGCGLHASVYQTLYCIGYFTGAIADIHVIFFEV